MYFVFVELRERKREREEGREADNDEMAKIRRRVILIFHTGVGWIFPTSSNCQSFLLLTDRPFLLMT